MLVLERVETVGGNMISAFCDKQILSSSLAIVLLVHTVARLE